MDKESANVGETVTVTVTPIGDYVISSVRVYNGYNAKNYSSSGLDLTANAEGKYEFTADLLNNVEVIFTDTPAVIETKAISELVDLTEKDNTVIQVTGAISSVYNTQYGNGYLVDLVTGEEINFYGLCDQSALVMTDSGEGYYTGVFTNNKSYSSLGLNVGDVITVYAVVDYYNNVQLNAVFVEKPTTWTSGDFAVTVNSSENGTAVPNVTTAKYGETVTLEVTPSEGYVVDSVIVNQGDFGSKTLSEDNGVYSFVSRLENVVSVSFRSINAPQVETLTIDFTGGPVAQNFGISTEAGSTGTFDYSNVTFAYNNVKAYSGYAMLCKSSSYICNTTAIPGVITKIEITTTNGASGSSVYYLNLSKSANDSELASGDKLTGIGSLAVEATAEDGYSYFNVTQKSSKNGQIAKIVITYIPSAS